eukprot:TRINITY_DN3600_c0_g1_i3.p1 TRINITY_DN3600_c0_g1~~TRINITY_DN3600_c0_g1_i3.p1  ORF type:complete len:451 (+),score=91.97 TRINITY_DN3600_c0_g1_i3:43-1395(+)
MLQEPDYVRLQDDQDEQLINSVDVKDKVEVRLKDQQIEDEKPKRSVFRTSEDWWSFYLGFFYVAGFLVATIAGFDDYESLNPEKWTSNPLDAFNVEFMKALPVIYVTMMIPLGFSAYIQDRSPKSDIISFTFAFVVTFFCYWLGSQDDLSGIGLGTSLWCFSSGLFITNFIGAPAWITSGSRAEYYIKIALVLLVVKFQTIVEVGAPALFVTWLVVPIVFFFIWNLGTRFFDIESKSLVCLISAATSICGSSAAAACAAACGASYEELTLAIGLTTVFSTIFMLADPYIAIATKMNENVAGAWIGGSVDSTGPVLISGAIVSEEAEDVASIVKMTQNVVIGPAAAAIAYYWVTHYGSVSKTKTESTWKVLWDRFPKFVLGFVLNSLIISFVLDPLFGSDVGDDIVDIAAKYSKWWETIAFVSIGIETNFAKLRGMLVGGKPIYLYLIGQV